VRLVGALLAPKIGRRVAPNASAIAPVWRILWPEALYRCPSLDQRAIDLEVIARQQPLDPWLGQHRAQELGRDLAVASTALGRALGLGAG
jgi:hypothetical protein